MKVLKNNIFIVLIYLYTALCGLCLINQLACYCYYKLGYAQEVRRMFPNEIVYPIYDMETNEVINADEVTVWNYSDFVPENRYRLHKYFRSVANTNGLIDTIILGVLFFPMLFLYHQTKKKPWITCVLLGLNLIVAFLLWRY